MARMKSAGPAPERRERRIVDRDALPDPAVYMKSSRGHGGAMLRIIAIVVALVGGLAAAGFGARALLSRTRIASVAALPQLEGLGASAGTAGGAREREAERPRLTPEQRAEYQKSWIGSESIAPRDDRVDRHTGERVAGFQGFGVSIDTAPPGARVLVNGQDLGTSPLLASVDCAAGDRVEVVAELGRRRGRAETRCRKDTLVKLSVDLRPSP
jgi:hypothetical protein